MSRKALLTVFLLFFLKGSNQVSLRRFNLIVDGMSCFPVTNSVRSFACEVRKLATNKYAFSAEIIFNKALQKNFFLRLFIDITPLSKNKSFNFLNLKMKACDALQTQFELPLLQQSIIEIRRTSNLPYQCPLKMGLPYFVKNFSFSDQSLNIFLPYLKFVQGIEFFESDKIIASLKTKGSLLPKLKNNKKKL